MTRIEYIRKRACELTGVAPELYRSRFESEDAREVVYDVMRRLGYYGLQEMIRESGAHSKKIAMGRPVAPRNQVAAEVIFHEVDCHRRNSMLVKWVNLKQGAFHATKQTGSVGSSCESTTPFSNRAYGV